eukprot:GHVR01085844.1.p1 GENE.GHVR01085844.1~~GHVR01085844.1.p1  ORF type:complete len:535 (+),score=115.37 GHVR01085844.1:206-1606(+)
MYLKKCSEVSVLTVEDASCESKGNHTYIKSIYNNNDNDIKIGNDSTTVDDQKMSSVSNNVSVDDQRNVSNNVSVDDQRNVSNNASVDDQREVSVPCSDATHVSVPCSDATHVSVPCSDATHVSVTCSRSSFWRSETNMPINKEFGDFLIFSGNSNLPLAHSAAKHLGSKLGAIKVQRFADGEVQLQVLESLRGKDVFIVQSTCPPVNENLVELLLMISTCRRSSAEKITAVIPYYGYARQDRKLSSRVPISAADVAKLIETMGVDRVIAVDLHSGQIQGFFGQQVPVDNLEAQVIGLKYFVEKGLKDPIIVSPDAGGVYRARKFQEGLIARGVSNAGLAMLIKQRRVANEIERMDLVGSVFESDVVIVDDMIDTAGTLCEAARELRRHGARRVFAFATHGVLSGAAVERIRGSYIEEVVLTDTIPYSQEARDCNKIKQLSIAVLIADAIRRVHQKESLNILFHEHA